MKNKKTSEPHWQSFKELAKTSLPLRHCDTGGITILLRFQKFRIMKSAELNISVWKPFS